MDFPVCFWFINSRWNYIVYMLKVNMTYSIFSLQYNNNTQLAQLNESQLVNGQQKNKNYCDRP